MFQVVQLGHLLATTAIHQKTKSSLCELPRRLVIMVMSIVRGSYSQCVVLATKSAL